MRQMNLCNLLKSCHRKNLVSITLPSVTLHTHCTNDRFQAINCTRAKSYNQLSPGLRNKKQLDVFQRSLSNNHHVIDRNTGLLSSLRNNIDPYKRLVRLDRPIGEEMIFILFHVIYNIFNRFFIYSFHSNRIMASVLAMRLEYCVERNSRRITKSNDIGTFRMWCGHNARCRMHNKRSMGQGYRCKSRTNQKSAIGQQ